MPRYTETEIAAIAFSIANGRPLSSYRVERDGKKRYIVVVLGSAGSYQTIRERF